MTCEYRTPSLGTYRTNLIIFQWIRQSLEIFLRTVILQRLLQKLISPCCYHPDRKTKGSQIEKKISRILKNFF
jgi:hypothetical protein